MKGLSSRLLPAYLLLCIVVGGSTQSAWGIAVLQLFAIALLAWAMLAPDTVPPPKAGKRLTILIGLLGLLFAVQLIPLPPAIWMAIPGREFVAHGFDLLGIPKPWLAASLAPYDTLSTALTLLPPLAIFVGMLRLRSWRISEMFAAVLLGAAIAIVLGALQLSKGQSWYLYEQTNLGIAVGTFANGNHFGTLMLVALPLFAAWTASGTRSATKPQQRAFATAMTVAMATMLAGGFLISRSVAVLLIAPAVAAATALMLFRWPKRRLRQGLAALGLLVVVAAGAVGFAGKYLPGWGTTASIETRKEYWSKTWHAAEEQWLTGSGFGTFQQDYRRYEDPSTINRFYVNHAHNDYAEIALEGGVPAILLVVLFLIWWGARSREAWLSPGAGVEQKAASIASAAILMHSAIDFPLRTAAIAAILAMCLGILSGARGTVKSSDDKKSRPARHATL